MGEDEEEDQPVEKDKARRRLLFPHENAVEPSHVQAEQEKVDHAYAEHTGGDNRKAFRRLEPARQEQFGQCSERQAEQSHDKEKIREDANQAHRNAHSRDGEEDDDGPTGL
jgi:hypothetical protein